MDNYSDNIALGIQTRLLQSFIELVRSSDEEGMLKATLQNTVDLATEITGAETGSLFLLDSKCVVTDCIMMREIPSGQDSARLIGSVLDKGLAGWVVKRREVGLINDTRHDNRWLDLPEQPYSVRSAIVTPILKGKSLFGILSLVHSEPDQFTDETASLMKATADHIAIVLENAKLYDTLNDAFHQLEKAKNTIEAYSNALTAELEKARQIQRDFLPDRIPELTNWEIETYFSPAKQVSGDFYDVFSLPGNTFGIVIADVADKGVGSALYMALIISLIRIFSGHISLHGFGNFSVNNGIVESTPARCATPDQLNALNAVKLTNDYISHEQGKEGMFATLFFGVIYPATGNMAYINAGHEPVFIVNTTRIVKSLKSTGPAVGVLHDIEFGIEQIHIEPGDILVGYTDGVTEAVGPNGDFFTRKRLISILEQTASSAVEVVAQIKSSLSAHIHNTPPSDDITLLAVQHLPLHSE